MFKDQRRTLLKNVLKSGQTLPTAQENSDTKKETNEFLAAKRRKREEEKKVEESKKTLLDKHHENFQKEKENGLI